MCLEISDEVKNVLMLLNYLMQEELGVLLLQAGVIASEFIVVQDPATLDVDGQDVRVT